MKTGFNQGPRPARLIQGAGNPLPLDLSLEDSVKRSLEIATWLEEADLAAATQAIVLAQTIDAEPSRRHQLSPILIGLLAHLGLLNNRKSAEMSPAEMLQSIANG